MAGYGDDGGFMAWLSNSGYDLPADAPAPAILRQRGSVYVDGTYGLRFPGTPTGGLAQERAWPRTSAATFFGASIPSDMIPTAVIEASYVAGLYEAENTGGLAAAVTRSAAIKREKVGPLETEYFEATGDTATDATPVLTAVEGLLAALLVPANLPYPLVV